MGVQAGQLYQGFGTVAVGLNAGQSNQGERAVAIGSSAGQSAQGSNAIAIGNGAGVSAQAADSIILNASIINLDASNSGLYVNPIRQEGNTQVLYYNDSTKEVTYSTITADSNAVLTSGDQTISGIKTFVDPISLPSNTIVFGEDIGDYSTGTMKIGTTSVGNPEFSYANTFVGFQAGYLHNNDLDGFNNTFMGTAAGYFNNANNNTFIGASAGFSNSGVGNTAVGGYAGFSSQSQFATAIGYAAGFENQEGDAIAIGPVAGRNNQGSAAIAIGLNAGRIQQTTNSIAIGPLAARNFQQETAVAIGYQAGYDSQQSRAIAIGLDAGYFGQGSNAIAIGRSAGYSNQAANSIVLNASDFTLDAANASLYVDPIRLDTSFAEGYLGYNSTTKEIVYNTGTATFGDVELSGATTDPSAGSAGDYLRIRINGTYYKIQLYADA
jgi:hypothetical protein